MNRHSIFILFVIFTSTQTSFSQGNKDTTQIKRNSLYIEIGGNTGSYSINYDLIICHKNNFKLTGRVGFSILPTNTCPTVFPIELNGLYGKTKQYFEYGIGYSPIIYLGKNKEKSSDLILARLGYRYQKTDGGLFFRIGFTPIIKNADDEFGQFRFTPWFGVSIGKTF